MAVSEGLRPGHDRPESGRSGSFPALGESPLLETLTGAAEVPIPVNGEGLTQVTSFFQNPATFELLKAAAFSRLLETRVGTGAIRVWALCCSSGEELYSLAIALLEFLSDAGRPDLPIQLFGTDLSSVAIDQARAAKYPPSIERDVSQTRLARFFEKSGEMYHIRKEVRDCCVFAQHDVTRDPPFSRIDLVSCRNPTLCFDPGFQDRILPLFQYALRSPGFLLLGASETTRDYPGFQAVDQWHELYTRGPSVPRVPFGFTENGRREPRLVDDWAKNSSQLEFDSPDARESSSAAKSELGPAVQLASRRRYLQSVVEQLEGKNQELQRANEEVVTSNEELRSTNEELQAAQEELRTLNDAMSVRNAESARLTDDLSNVLSSVAIPILILDQASRVRRFTTPAGKLFRLTANDVGRPIGDIRSKLQIPDLSRLLAEVLAHLRAVERTVRDDDGRWYQLVVRPYLTTDKRVDGTTVVCFDIDALKKTQQELLSARTYAESVIDTVGECLLVVDRNLCVHSGNRAFYRTFKLTPGEAEGRALPLRGPRDGGASSLAKRLLALTEGASFRGVRETLTLPQQGERTFALSGRHIDGTPWFLLALDDISEQVQAEQRLRDSQERIQQLAFERSVAEERERRRIASDLHDRIGQALALAQIKLAGIQGELSGATRAAVDEAVRLLAQSVLHTRTLTFELSPPVLYDLGLKEALAWLAEQIESEHGLRVEVTDDGLGAPLEEATMALVFRAVRELLVNVIKHAQSKTAQVTLHRTRDYVEISVEDPGVGFDSEPFPAAARGYGLFSVREQIGRLGGSIVVDSAPREGTRVQLRLPIRLPAGAATPPLEASS